MRHRKNNVGLNRTAAHRKAMLANLTSSLVIHKKVVTTLPKARAARKFAEKMITFARRGDVAARRQVYRHIPHRDIVHELFTEIGPKFKDRNGGYTRIIKMDRRHGDNAPLAILELVGFAADEPVKSSGSSRRRKTAPKKAESGKKETAPKKSESAKAAEEAEPTVTEQSAAADTEALVEEPKEAADPKAEEASTGGEIVEGAVQEPVDEAADLKDKVKKADEPTSVETDTPRDDEAKAEAPKKGEAAKTKAAKAKKDEGEKKESKKASSGSKKSSGGSKAKKDEEK